jgi:hypothetical protein
MKSNFNALFLGTALTHGLSAVGFSPSVHGRHLSHGLPASIVLLDEMPAMMEAKRFDPKNDASISQLKSMVEFPLPLGKIDRLKRAVTFWLSTAPIVVDYVGLLGQLKAQELRGMALSSHEEEVSH